MSDHFFPALDFSRDGRQETLLAIPVSIDRSPYYRVQIPVTRLRNGDGPSLLIMAGNHGDEYEGPFAINHLLRKIEPEQIEGSLTIIPAINQSAVAAAKRCSELDGGNLNRSFPGVANGGYTARLAHVLEHKLFPAHDYVFDLHAGGTSMAHAPCALMDGLTEDDPRLEEARALMLGLGLPLAFMTTNGPDSNGALGGIRRAGGIGICAEFGGGASITPDSMRYTRGAIDRVLLMTGIVKEPILDPAASYAPLPCQELLVRDQDRHWIYAPRSGWFESALEVGQTVAEGALAGYLHDLIDTSMEPRPLYARETGIVLSRRLHCKCEPGDCLMQIGRPV